MRQTQLKLHTAALTFLTIICYALPSHAEDANKYWIDVRTPAEFASGHVEGAANIEFQLISEQIATITNNVDAEIHLYCRSGRRSGVAKQTLEDLGFRNVTNEGGIAHALVSFQKQKEIAKVTD